MALAENGGGYLGRLREPRITQDGKKLTADG